MLQDLKLKYNLNKLLPNELNLVVVGCGINLTEHNYNTIYYNVALLIYNKALGFSIGDKLNELDDYYQVGVISILQSIQSYQVEKGRADNWIVNNAINEMIIFNRKYKNKNITTPNLPRVPILDNVREDFDIKDKVEDDIQPALNTIRILTINHYREHKRASIVIDNTLYSNVLIIQQELRMAPQIGYNNLFYELLDEYNIEEKEFNLIKKRLTRSFKFANEKFFLDTMI